MITEIILEFVPFLTLVTLVGKTHCCMYFTMSIKIIFIGIPFLVTVGTSIALNFASHNYVIISGDKQKRLL